jgi:hypothetical protein
MEVAATHRRNELHYANRFEIDRWAWNVAMQDTNLNSAPRRHMRGFTLPQTNAHARMPNYPAREHWRPVMQAMQAHNTRHGVTEAEWTQQLVQQMEVEDFEEENRSFYNLGISLAAFTWIEHRRTIENNNLPPSPLRHILSNSSILRQPIGGLFKLNSMEDRINAGAWLSSRVNLPEADWPRPNHPDNYAILAIGPGGLARLVPA